ncbi:ribonuclease HI [bacterium]|nr:ribonuclease HI [bacterium]
MQSAPRRREVSLFCDGSCLGSRGVGAWAYLLIDRETGFQQWNRGADLDTTNNRMELMAVIQGLSSLPESSRVHLVVDSQYVSLGVTERLQIWMARGWRSSGAGSRRVMNVDLWERLAEQLSRHEFDCQWVRGHSGHPENEFVDQMARTIAEQAAALQRGGLMSG